MTSLRESVSDLERRQATRDMAVDCYLTAIRNLSQYAIELDDEITGAYKKYLATLWEDTAPGTIEALDESRATLRGLLRDYRDKASQYLGALRSELSAAAYSLQEILDGLSQSDGDHDARLRAALQRLRAITGLTDPAAIHAAVLAASNSIEESLEQIRKQHQLTVSQFLVEIRMLHKRIDALERAASLDSLTKLITRAEFESRLRALPDTRLAVLLVRVQGFVEAEEEFGVEVAAELAAAFTRRMRNSLPANAQIARWGEQEFVAAIPNLGMGDALANAKWISDHLSGAYACLRAGRTVRPNVSLHVDVMEAPGREMDRIVERAEKYFGKS
ncbi:MAG TPA: GGDEF domain-containing protein [Bryobacteraceae bacterium]